MKFDVKLLTEFLLQLQWKLWFPSDYVGSSLLYQTIMFYWTIYQDEIHVKKSVKTWGDNVLIIRGRWQGEQSSLEEKIIAMNS